MEKRPWCEKHNRNATLLVQDDKEWTLKCPSCRSSKTCNGFYLEALSQNYQRIVFDSTHSSIVDTLVSKLRDRLNYIFTDPKSTPQLSDMLEKINSLRAHPDQVELYKYIHEKGEKMQSLILERERKNREAMG